MANTRKKNIGSTVTSRVSSFYSQTSSRIKDLNTRQRSKVIWRKTTVFVQKRPMASFFIALFILFLAIVLNSVISPKPKETTTLPPVKEVTVYKVGVAPRVSISAKVKKAGVIQIVAQTPGIVSAINVVEGQTVTRGTNLLSLANNYQGGNAFSVQRQIAADQYQNVQDTYDAQKDSIGKQMQIADANKNNSDMMRSLINQSISDTQGLIDFNDNILSTLNANLKNLEDSNNNGSNDSAILALKGQIAQVGAAVAQLNISNRQARFQSDTANPPTQLADFQHDLAVRQFQIQQKMLDLGRETSRLGLALAQINEATMYPSAPFDGVIERVHAVVGQSVAPGTPLVTISGTNKKTTVIAYVPRDIAEKVSKIESSRIYVGKKVYEALPDYVSTEATDGLLNVIIYTLPDDATSLLTDSSYIRIEVPVGYADTMSTIPQIPIDNVFQTQDGAFTYVTENGKAVARRIELGDVLGSFVTVEKGLKAGDHVILDRNIVAGDQIHVNN